MVYDWKLSDKSYVNVAPNRTQFGDISTFKMWILIDEYSMILYIF